MAIVYHGQLEELARGVTEAKPFLDRGFREILGPYRAQQLQNKPKDY